MLAKLLMLPHTLDVFMPERAKQNNPKLSWSPELAELLRQASDIFRDQHIPLTRGSLYWANRYNTTAILEEVLDYLLAHIADFTYTDWKRYADAFTELEFPGFLGPNFRKDVNETFNAIGQAIESTGDWKGYRLRPKKDAYRRILLIYIALRYFIE